MFSAAVRGHLETVRALLRANANPLLTANVDQQCRKTDVPLDAAAYSGHTEIVRELVEQVGIEGCGGASGGADALGLASIGQHVDIMAILALPKAQSRAFEAHVKTQRTTLLYALRLPPTETTIQSVVMQFQKAQQESQNGWYPMANLGGHHGRPLALTQVP